MGLAFSENNAIFDPNLRSTVPRSQALGKSGYTAADFGGLGHCKLCRGTHLFLRLPTDR